MTCSSMNVHFSCTMTYGSSGQSFVSPGNAVAPHCLGKVNPEKPPCTVNDATCLHDLHVILNVDALDVRTEAEITIPGSRTSLEM